ncbi:MarR family winged helix-turn-helix transcriptional regulator [Euzebya tangerina]|uniref:MarR family winged helix-turn-helix transcriptional regulator n=1 Tax=Euzebya tangerina TaxID=591198 RepID=UPI000E30D429|nr:MarR family winged helix-turn-helix transcriptional regulator [Euzebya tangerina]
MAAPPPPPEEDPRLGLTSTFALIGIGRLLTRRLERALEPGRLTLRHLGALGHLRRDPGISVTDLAARARVGVSTMHDTIADLRDRSLVIQGNDGGRGRRAELLLTPAGEAALDEAGAVAARIDHDVLTELEGLQPRLLAIATRLLDQERAG